MICVDTSPLIWGLRKEAEKDQQHMICRAEDLFEDLRRKSETVAIPSLVIWEACVRLPDSVRAPFWRSLVQDFVILDFDAVAALKAAEIQAGFIRTSNYSRSKFKVDCCIVASAVTAKCRVIYTEDSDIVRLAGSQSLKALPMPQSKTALVDGKVTIERPTGTPAD